MRSAFTKEIIWMQCILLLAGWHVSVGSVQREGMYYADTFRPFLRCDCLNFIWVGFHTYCEYCLCVRSAPVSHNNFIWTFACRMIMNRQHESTAKAIITSHPISQSIGWISYNCLLLGVSNKSNRSTHESNLYSFLLNSFILETKMFPNCIRMMCRK